MPDIDGLDLCRRLSPASTTPVILMSNGDSVHAEVAALEAGPTTTLKPFQPESLLARVKLALRRSGGRREASVVGVGPFHIDFNDRRVRVHGQAVRLTPKEFDLFTFMARHPEPRAAAQDAPRCRVGRRLGRTVRVPAGVRGPAAQEAEPIRPTRNIC